MSRRCWQDGRRDQEQGRPPDAAAGVAHGEEEEEPGKRGLPSEGEGTGTLGERQGMVGSTGCISVSFG